MDRVYKFNNKVIETWLLVDSQQIDCKPKWKILVEVTTQAESEFIWRNRHGAYYCEPFCDGAINSENIDKNIDMIKIFSFYEFYMFLRDFHKNITGTIEKYNAGTAQ